MQKPTQNRRHLKAFLVSSLLCPLTLSAAVSDPSNPADPVIDITAPVITAGATDLSNPVDASPTPPNVPPVMTPSLDSVADGIVKGGIEITDDGTTFTFKPTGEIGPLGPGEHTITWTATDLGLNQVSADQVITILPSVNLEADQEGGEGGTTIVTAHLSGLAPSYPVEIPYTVNNGTTNATDHNAVPGNFVFAANETSASVEILITDDGPGDPGETFNIDFGPLPTTQVFAGHQLTHEITITEANQKPLAQLHAKQNEKITRTITTDAGTVTICAMPDCGHAFDADGDEIQYDWSATDNALIPLTGTTDNTFEFETQSLNPGFYTIRLTISDNTDPGLAQSSSHDLLLRLFESEITLTEADSDGDQISNEDEGYFDDDNDGIPNHLDALNSPTLIQAHAPYLFDPNLKTEDSYTIDSIELSWELSSSSSNMVAYPLLISTDPGLRLNIGPTAFAAGKAYARLGTNTAEELRGATLPDNMVSSDAQVIDIEITNLNGAGDSAQIILPQATPIPAAQAGAANPQFYVFKNTKSWGIFEAEGNNEIKIKKEKLANNYCPGVDGIGSYTTSTDINITGHNCLLINIEDGGPNDYDGIANGTIRLMGAVFITSASVADDQASDIILAGDTSSTQEGQHKLDLGTGDGGGSLTFISLLALFVSLLSRRATHTAQ